MNAFWCWPKLIPSASKNRIILPGEKFFEPLKAMCSRKCATPRWFSASSMEPAWMCSIIETLPGGVLLGRIQ